MSGVLSDFRRTPLYWLIVFVPVVFVAEKLRPEGHTLVFLLSRRGHRSARWPPFPRDGERRGEDRGRDRRAPQCHARQPDGARHRDRGAARRHVRPGQGVARRGHRDEQPLHARRRVPPGRASPSRAGVQPAQRPCPGGDAAARLDRPGHHVGHRPHRPAQRRRLQDAARPHDLLHPARDLRAEPALLAQDAPRVLHERGEAGSTARRPGRSRPPWDARGRHGPDCPRQRDLRRVRHGGAASPSACRRPSSGSSSSRSSAPPPR